MLSGFELSSRWVPLASGGFLSVLYGIFPKFSTKILNNFGGNINAWGTPQFGLKFGPLNGLSSLGNRSWVLPKFVEK